MAVGFLVGQITPNCFAHGQQQQEQTEWIRGKPASSSRKGSSIGSKEFRKSGTGGFQTIPKESGASWPKNIFTRRKFRYFLNTGESFGGCIRKKGSQQCNGGSV